MAEAPGDKMDAPANCPLNCCQSEKRSKMGKIVAYLNLMIFMLLFGFSISIHIRYRDNLIYRQICRARFLDDYYKFCYESSEQKRNVTSKDLQVLEVLDTSTSHVFAMIGLKIIFETFSSCLLCSWSDSCGRKFPLLIALLGENFDISSFFFRDVPFIYFICALYTVTALSGLFGGYLSIFTMCYCYLTDCYSTENRALGFTMINCTYMLGIIGGVVVFTKLLHGNVILQSFVNIIVVRCILIIWMLLTFSEKDYDLKKEKILKQVRLLFSSVHLKKTYEAFTAWRSNCQHEQLVLLACSALPVMVIYTLIEGVVFTSILHAKLFKSLTSYEEITLYFAIYSCFAEPIAIVIYSCLAEVKDSTLGIVGFWCLHLDAFISAFATDSLTFLVGLGLFPLKGFAVIALRSAYSKIANENECGKLFFIYSFCEILAMFIGYFIYEKLNLVLTPKDDILPDMFMSTALILSFCTFTFQVISIETDHLFGRCYSTIPTESERRVQNLSPSSSS